MRLPFTTDQFLDVFRAYNDAVWPAQWLLYALGVIAAVSSARRARWGGRVVMRDRADQGACAGARARTRSPTSTAAG